MAIQEHADQYQNRHCGRAMDLIAMFSRLFQNRPASQPDNSNMSTPRH